MTPDEIERTIDIVNKKNSPRVRTVYFSDEGQGFLERVSLKTEDGVKFFFTSHQEGNRKTRRSKARAVHSNNKSNTPGRKWNIKHAIY